MYMKVAAHYQCVLAQALLINYCGQQQWKKPKALGVLLLDQNNSILYFHLNTVPHSRRYRLISKPRFSINSKGRLYTSSLLNINPVLTWFIWLKNRRVVTDVCTFNTINVCMSSNNYYWTLQEYI